MISVRTMENMLTEETYREIFKALQELSGISIFLLDETFNVIWANTRHHCFLKRIPRKEGTYSFRLIRGQDGACHSTCPMNPWKSDLAEQYTETAKDLEIIYHVCVQARHDDQGEIDGYMVVQIDDTKHFIEENRRTQEISRRFFSHLASDVAHEINNPLTILYGLLQEYNRYPKLNAYQKNDFKKMINASNRIREFVDYMLRFSTEEIQDDEVQDIQDVLLKVMRFFQEFLRVKGIKIDFKIQGETCPLHIKTSMFEKILFNLIHYIADSIAPGGTIRILADHSQSRNHLHLSFSSSDFLITPESLENIFLNFGENHGMDAIHSLGMSTVYNLIKDHNGDIRVERPTENELAIHLGIPID
jgi:signal transduction histidine kinase